MFQVKKNYISGEYNDSFNVNVASFIIKSFAEL